MDAPALGHRSGRAGQARPNPQLQERESREHGAPLCPRWEADTGCLLGPLARADLRHQISRAVSYLPGLFTYCCWAPHGSPDVKGALGEATQVAGTRQYVPLLSPFFFVVLG